MPHTHTQRCAHTLVSHTGTFIQQSVPHSHHIDNTGVCALAGSAPPGASLALRRWGMVWESSPLATCWPLSHADDPGLTPEGLGPSSFQKHGMGAGQRRPHAAHMRTRASNTEALPSPGRLHHRGLKQWERWPPHGPESQVSSCFDGGGEQDRVEQPPPQAHCLQVSGLRLRQSPPPWP